MNDTDLDPAQLRDLARGRLPKEEAAILRERIESDPQARADFALVEKLIQNTGSAAPFPGELGWRRLSAALNKPQKQKVWRRSVPIWQAAASVFGAVALWQVVAVPVFQAEKLTEPKYVTAGETQKEQFVLRVSFAPQATIVEVNSVLAELGAQLVAGPSSLGIYTVSFETEADRDFSLEELRSMDDLVLLAVAP